MSPIDSLIKTAEILRDAVLAKDKDKGFEAVTIFLMQFMGAFGGSQNMVAKMLPVLEGVKDHILSDEFEKAIPFVDALLANLRSKRTPIPSGLGLSSALTMCAWDCLRLGNAGALRRSGG